jgi:type II secretion system protein G
MISRLFARPVARSKIDSVRSACREQRKEVSSLSKGFTLIELLIVVAIIAILAAIAVPNFLEAQTRSKVARCKTDMRSLATAIESYYVDNNRYPDAYRAHDTNNFNNRLMQVTTPVAYITSLPVDPFASRRTVFPYTPNSTYQYVDRKTAVFFEGAPRSFGNFQQSSHYDSYFESGTATAWSMYSPGPDYNRDPFGGPAPYGSPVFPPRKRVLESYDPTNGTVSPGAVWRTNVVTGS